MASTFSLSFGGWKLERWLRLISDFFHAGLSYATFTSVVNGTWFVPVTFRVIGFIWFPGLPSCASGIFFTPSQGKHVGNSKSKKQTLCRNATGLHVEFIIWRSSSVIPQAHKQFSQGCEQCFSSWLRSEKEASEVGFSSYKYKVWNLHFLVLKKDISLGLLLLCRNSYLVWTRYTHRSLHFLDF